MTNWKGMRIKHHFRDEAYDNISPEELKQVIKKVVGKPKPEQPQFLIFPEPSLWEEQEVENKKNNGK